MTRFYDGRGVARGKKDPKEYLTQAENIIHVYGGGIPLLFGSPESSVWAKIKQTAEQNDGEINVAGINFTTSELGLLGEFYRFLRDFENKSFTCIDDRLKIDSITHGNDTHGKCLVHQSCGAAAAVGRAIAESLATAGAGPADLEDIALKELGQTEKQPLAAGMESAHNTSTILLNFGSDGLVVKPDVFDTLVDEAALPMNVTIPLQLVESFAIYKLALDENTRAEGVRSSLPSALFKWNADIAKAVIGDKAHNEGGSENILVVSYTPPDLGQQPLDVLHRYLIDPEAASRNKGLRDRYFILSQIFS